MSHRHANPLLVTVGNGSEPERVLYKELGYDEVMQLPLVWGLWRVDAARMSKRKKGSSDDEDDDDLAPVPEKLKHKISGVKPQNYYIYLMHKNTIYKAAVSAAEVSEKLRNGRATFEVYATPVQSESEGDDVASGVGKAGFVVGISPTEATSTMHEAGGEENDALLGSHPIAHAHFSKSVSFDQPIESTALPKSVRSTVSKLGAFVPSLSMGSQSGTQKKKTSSDKKDSEGGEQGESGEGDFDDMTDMASKSNPIFQMLVGGVFEPGTAAISVEVTVALYPMHPAQFANAIQWQQEQSLLSRNGVRAAWSLSRISPNLITATMVRLLTLVTVIALWTMLYQFVPEVRELADTSVARFHAQLPAEWQERAAKAWHLIVPQWMLVQFAPSFLTVMIVLVLPFLPPALLHSSRLTVWWLSACSLGTVTRAYGTVYGISVTGAKAISPRSWAEIRKAGAERPDLSKGISNSSWITDDVQERFWHNNSANAAAAHKQLAASASWRSKLGIDNILSAKQPHFYVMKKAFPHGVLCKSKSGHVVFVMRICSLLHQYKQIEEAGLSNDDIVAHLAFIYEYMFRQCDPRDLPNGRLINILDMEGLGVMETQSKAAKLGNLASRISAQHYPDRLHKALIINCPGLVNQMWSVVKGMVDKNAQDRTELYTKNDTLKGLKTVLEESDIPKIWGGSREYPFYNHELEVNMFKIVAKNNGDSLQDYAIDDMFEPPKEK